VSSLAPQSLARAGALRDPAWQSRLALIVIALVLLVPALIAVEFRPWVLLQADSLKSMGKFLKDFLVPAHSSEFLQLVAKETWRTIAIATVGMTLAWVLAVPLVVIGTRATSLSAIKGRMDMLPLMVRQILRAILILLRSVPELVWALVFVRVAGLGVTAGVLAIALTYAGMLGKVYIEILESADQQAGLALMRNGAGRLQTLCYAFLPQCATELTSYTVYRWECAIRSSAVLGFVGAGGLGQQLDVSMKMFRGDEVATLLIVFIFLVWIADKVSFALRKAMA
jgi:phosphonate transport system permease protein